MKWIVAKRRCSVALDRLMRKQYVHILHVGKTGGSAVKKALEGNLQSTKYKIFCHSHNYSLANVPEGEKIVFFLRDPASRFVSGFYSRQREGRPKYFYPWTEGEGKAFKMFRTPNELAVSLSSSNSKTREEACFAMENIGHVRDFYSRWYKDEDYFLSRLPDILLVGRQETLARNFAMLKSLLDLPECVELPSGDEEAHRNPHHLDKDLERKAMLNLSKWYAMDYAFLELCAEYADFFNYSGTAEVRQPVPATQFPPRALG